MAKIFSNDQENHDGGREIFEVIFSTFPLGILGVSISLYQGNHDEKHRLLLSYHVDMN